MGGIHKAAKRLSHTLRANHLCPREGWVRRVSLAAGCQLTGSRPLPPKTSGGVQTVRRRTPWAPPQPSTLSLFFLTSHPFPQVLTDISQRVCFGREGLNCFTEAGSLRFTEWVKGGRKKKTRHMISAAWMFRDVSGILKDKLEGLRVEGLLQELAFLQRLHLTKVCWLSSLHGSAGGRRGQKNLYKKII